mgnify:CR=1 FL=1|jgi:hypothetical protein
MEKQSIIVLEEHITAINTIADRKSAFIKELGEIEHQRLILKKRKIKAIEFSDQTEIQAQQLGAHLEDVYGKGKIDLDTRTFLPLT